MSEAQDPALIAGRQVREHPVRSRRCAGVGIHFSSLPGAYGIGDIGGAARRFAAFMRECGLTVWQFLPLGPTAFGDSPYQPLSVFAGNPLLIDLDPLVDEGWLHESELTEFKTLPADVVRYDQLVPLKLEVLWRAADRFVRGAGRPARIELAEFVHDEGQRWLDDYALYDVLKQRHGLRPWHLWEPQYANRDEKSLARIRRECGEALHRTEIVQFWFHQQWQQLRTYAREFGVLLFGDLPIYVAADSAEAWSGQALLQLSENGTPAAVAGVPPDYFSEEGQWWGNPLYCWEAHAESGYAWWTNRMQQATARFDVIRLDHFRGFESYWSIPAGARSAREGRWIQGPGTRLFDALEAALGPLPVVAEDLGVITPEVEALRDRYHFPGMQVLQFLLEDPAFSLDRVSRNCVCYTGTHDNDTAIGWLTNVPVAASDSQQRKEILEQIAPRAAHLGWSLIELACRSRAQWVIAPMQDFLGLDSSARMNTPGRADNNWRWRLQSEQMTRALAESIYSTLALSERVEREPRSVAQ